MACFERPWRRSRVREPGRAIAAAINVDRAPGLDAERSPRRAPRIARARVAAYCRAVRATRARAALDGAGTQLPSRGSTLTLASSSKAQRKTWPLGTSSTCNTTRPASMFGAATTFGSTPSRVSSSAVSSSAVSSSRAFAPDAVVGTVAPPRCAGARAINTEQSAFFKTSSATEPSRRWDRPRRAWVPTVMSWPPSSRARVVSSSAGPPKRTRGSTDAGENTQRQGSRARSVARDFRSSARPGCASPRRHPECRCRRHCSGARSAWAPDGCQVRPRRSVAPRPRQRCSDRSNRPR